MDDNYIIDLFWQRSEDALAECNKKFGSYCRVIAKNILYDDGYADECVNDMLLRAWNAIPPEKPQRLKVFLAKITRNLALDRYDAIHTQKRGSSNIEVTLEELADIPAPENSDDGEITHSINTFLHSEPPENADIFMKRYWYLCSIREIANEYKYSESKIASLLLRMRGRLKQKLESENLL